MSNIEITKEVLEKPLALVTTVCKAKTLPILSNVAIKCEKNSIVICGTDLETEISATIPVTSEFVGEFSVNAKKLYDIVRALPTESSLNIAVSNQSIVVKSGRGRYKLGVLPFSDFPFIEVGDSEYCEEFDSQALLSMLEKTAFSMTDQETRVFMNGMRIQATDSVLSLTSTNGHRLASYSYFIEDDADIYNMDVIIPKKSVLELMKMLGKNEASVKLSKFKNVIEFNMLDFSLKTKLIDDQYPDLSTVISLPDGNLATVNVSDLRNAIKRISALTDSKTNACLFKFTDGRLLLTAKNAEKEEAKDEVEIQYSGDEIELGMNLSYFTDCLSHFDEEIKIHFGEMNNRIVLTPIDKDNYRYVVMPMRI